MSTERRIAPGRRVQFERAREASIIGLDGTWKTQCEVYDVSDGGARLVVCGPMNGQQLQEFFLVFPGNGLTYRRCELRWCKGDNIGVKFIKTNSKKKRQAPAANSEDTEAPAPSASLSKRTDWPRNVPHSPRNKTVVVEI